MVADLALVRRPALGRDPAPSVWVSSHPTVPPIEHADSGVQFPASTPVAEVTACQFTNPLEAVIKRRAMDHQRPSRGLGIAASGEIGVQSADEHIRAAGIEEQTERRREVTAPQLVEGQQDQETVQSQAFPLDHQILVVQIGQGDAKGPLGLLE